jgi:hypothetical protein
MKQLRVFAFEKKHYPSVVPEADLTGPILSTSDLFMRCNSTGRDIRGFRNAANVLWSFLELIEYREVFGGMFTARQARMRDRQEREICKTV